MLLLACTTDIIGSYTFLSKDELYSKAFPSAFDAVRGQILKFEREQTYREPGKSWDAALQRGDVSAAVALIPDLIEENSADYEELKQRKIEFIRCRPIKFPATPYLKWEVAAYQETSKIFEKVYWCLYSQLDDIFDRNARHDFMVFDARMAIIQDYDDEGFLRGGWLVEQPNHVVQLLGLFAYIKANSMALELLQSDKLTYE